MLPYTKCQLSSQVPVFTKDMDSLTIYENRPIGEIVYTLEAKLDEPQPGVSILYNLEGTKVFTVDKVSGAVKVAQTIDREQTDSINFQVSATSVLNNGPSQRIQYGPSTQIRVNVLVLDENDNPPKIDIIQAKDSRLDANSISKLSNGLLVVKLNISESTPVSSNIVDLIEAVDLDKFSPTSLRASCEGCEPEFELRTNSESIFSERLSLALVLNGTLVHRPRDNVRMLSIIVTDGKYNTTVLFEITIEDVQNKRPVFIGSSTRIVYENLPIDRTIMTIQAVDGDALKEDEPPTQAQGGRTIVYDLVGVTNEDFKLHPLSGQLQVANRLDREAYLGENGVVTLRVRARELISGLDALMHQEELYESMLDKLSLYVDPSPQATNEMDITVILADMNDNEPHWLNSSEIRALNVDQSTSWHNFLPKDRDAGRIYHFKVKESSLPGAPLTANNEIFVYDLDSGDNAVFNISLIDPFNLFDVEPKQVSGFAMITLKLANQNLSRKPRMLDYESLNDRNFIIQLVATETRTAEHLNSKAQIHITVLDVNDNAPEFKEASYNANVREDAPPGKTIVQIQATDKDEISKSLRYSIHGRTAHLFDINPQTGLISVAKCDANQALPAKPQRLPVNIRPSPCIDFESQKSHNLMVEVSDGELSSKVPLTIHVEDFSDNPPVFALPIVDVVIEEGSDKIDPPLRVEAMDVDQSSVITYSIVEGNFEGLFAINNNTGELQLTRPIKISHDELSMNEPGQQLLNKMTLIIQATDGYYATNGTVRIDVLDANDNPPKFLRSHYSAEIAESAQPGQIVVTVRAIDSDRGNNARVYYKLLRGSHGQFEVDESTGVVTVSNQARPFDILRKANYTLEIVAYDHGIVSKSSSTSVSIAILPTNKRAPEFDPQIQRVVVPENIFNNNIIHQMTVAGELTNSLIFEPGPIEALDKNGQPVASHESDKLESMFRVSTHTGDVLVNSALDHDFAAHINLTIYVSSRQPSISAINTSEPLPIEEFHPRSVGYLIISVVDYNTNPPVFAPPWTPQKPELSFQMLEELPVGSVLAQLVASDIDSKISHFKIDPPNDYFELTAPQSGIIVNRKLIDYDTLMSQTFLTPASQHRALAYGSSSLVATSSLSIGNNVIQFNVYVYDSGSPQLSTKATISVEVLPTNDWDCKFEQSTYEVHVKENSPVDTLVVQVRANDLDFGEQHSSIRYQLVGEYNDFFNIDQRTGLVTISSFGSLNLDRERLGRSKLYLTIVGRDEQPQQIPASHLYSPSKPKINQKNPHHHSRSCSATIKIHIDDINDNPPLFAQKIYEVTAYDTDMVDVPLLKLMVRDEDSINLLNSSFSKINQSAVQNTFKIVSGNLREAFNVTNTGLIYMTKALNEILDTNPNVKLPLQLRVQVRQHSTSSVGPLTSFTDECLVKVNFVKINRHGPEWRFESPKSMIGVAENVKADTLVTRLKCIDRDIESHDRSTRLMEPVDNDRTQTVDSIRYWIKENGTNVLETKEFKLDSVTGELVTRIELDRESHQHYHLVVACEDNGKPQSLESVTTIFVNVLDVDDNKPEFVVPRKGDSASLTARSNGKIGVTRPVIQFEVEEHQSRGIPVGEIKAIDRDIVDRLPMVYCILDGNEFAEFSLDKVTGILYTNQTLDREKQASYDLIVKAVNDGSDCDDQPITSYNGDEQVLNRTNNFREPKDQPSEMISQNERRKLYQGSNFLSIRIDVLDINDNAPIFKRSVFKAGAHHRSLMNTLVTQVTAFDSDSDLNGTLSYRILETLLYKTNPADQQSSSRKYEVTLEQTTLSKPIRLIQSPFKIDQQGNLYTQQLLTQYQLMSMFVLTIEAVEQAEPWRTARTRLEVYLYETSNQLKMRINLHPRLVELYRSDIETLLSNATKFTAIINRARSYSGNQIFVPAGLDSLRTGESSVATPTINLQNSPNSFVSDEPSYSNIHLIFVDNFRIVNPNLVMEKFDLTSAQLFMPQTIMAGESSYKPTTDRLQVNEVSSFIDRIALASVQSAEYSGSSSLAGIDWLESPSVLYVTLTIILTVAGFVVFLFGCCCTSRIKDHIVKVAMAKLVKQQQLQAKISDQMLSASSQANGGSRAAEADLSSFDTTKGCIMNNQENMNLMHRAMESGEFVDPTYTTLNGHVNMGAHYYDPSELEQQAANITTNGFIGNSKQPNSSNNSLSLAHDDIIDDNDAARQAKKRLGHQGNENGNALMAQQQQNQRLRQQIPNSS